MTRIEGITPPKKHKTVTQRRGAYAAHHELHAQSKLVEHKIVLIAALSLFALVVVWVVLLMYGNILPKQNTDKTFFQSLGEKLNTDFPVRELPDATDDTLFPSP